MISPFSFVSSAASSLSLFLFVELVNLAVSDFSEQVSVWSGVSVIHLFEGTLLGAAVW